MAHFSRFRRQLAAAGLLGLAALALVALGLFAHSAQAAAPIKSITGPADTATPWPHPTWWPTPHPSRTPCDGTGPSRIVCLYRVYGKTPPGDVIASA